MAQASEEEKYGFEQFRQYHAAYGYQFGKAREVAPAKALAAFSKDANKVVAICKFHAMKEINEIMHNIGNICVVTLDVTIFDAAASTIKSVAQDGGVSMFRVSTSTYVVLMDNGDKKAYLSQFEMLSDGRNKMSAQGYLQENDPAVQRAGQLLERGKKLFTCQFKSGDDALAFLTSKANESDKDFQCDCGCSHGLDLGTIISKWYDIALSIDIDKLSSIVKNKGMKAAAEKIVQVGQAIVTFCNTINDTQDAKTQWIPYHHHGDEYVITVGNSRNPYDDSRVYKNNIKRDSDALLLHGRYSLLLIGHVKKECGVGITIGVDESETMADIAQTVAKKNNHRGVVAFHSQNMKNANNKSTIVDLTYIAKSDDDIDKLYKHAFTKIVYADDREQVIPCLSVED